MNSRNFLFIFILVILFIGNTSGQVDEICSEMGFTPSLDSPFAQVPYIYGRINLRGFENTPRMPNVVITMIDSKQATSRLTLNKSGNYCFKVKNNGGTLIVEVDGVEVTRKALPAFGPPQIREDFEIFPNQNTKSAPPGVISAKFSYPINPKTVGLYKKLQGEENKKDSKTNIEIYKEIVLTDPADFIAWAQLGSNYFEQKDYQDAVSAYRKSLELKIDYTPAWINVGMIRVAQKQFEAAVEIFKHTTTLEPNSGSLFRLLGEAYLENKQGTLGAEALNKAIELDPIGMAECHLELAHLYRLAKANKLATKEYRVFLSKVANHPDKKKFEKFIKENPEK